MKHLIIKGIGPDRPGIVSDISKFVTSSNGNIEESRMIRLGSEFSIIMLISIPDNSQDNLSAQLESIEGIKFYLTPTRKLSSYEYPNYIISISGADNEGIVYQFSNYLSKMNINIEEINTDIKNAPVSATPLFMMDVIIGSRKKINERKIIIELNKIAEKLGVEVELKTVK